MSVVDIDGIVKILNEDGYTKEFLVTDNTSTGVFTVGKVHVPKLYIGKKALLTVEFIE